MSRILLFVTLVILSSCSVSRPTYVNPSVPQGGFESSTNTITKSLFSDKKSTISEESIQKILDGKYSLPEDLRVSIVKLPNKKYRSNFYWNNEEYLKSQQDYMDMFKGIFKQSTRTKKVSAIPDILISSNPTYTSIRESAVRSQSDIVVIYSINSDLYSKYKLFSKSEIKAFATTQLILLDVRTGLIPFSTIVTKDFISTKLKSDMNNSEASNRIQKTAVLMTIEEIGKQLKRYLAE